MEICCGLFHSLLTDHHFCWPARGYGSLCIAVYDICRDAGGEASAGYSNNIPSFGPFILRLIRIVKRIRLDRRYISRGIKIAAFYFYCSQFLVPVTIDDGHSRTIRNGAVTLCFFLRLPCYSDRALTCYREITCAKLYAYMFRIDRRIVDYYLTVRREVNAKAVFHIEDGIVFKSHRIACFRAVCNNAIRIAGHCQLHIVKHKPSVVHIIRVRRADQDSPVCTFIRNNNTAVFNRQRYTGVIYIYGGVTSRIGVCMAVQIKGPVFLTGSNFVRAHIIVQQYNVPVRRTARRIRKISVNIAAAVRFFY